MENDKLILGIDTSNYTTSAALSDLTGNIIADERRVLKVSQGQRGLRQSDALFQHVENLPEILKKVMTDARKQMGNFEIAAVCASDRPRPVEGSYMPVFRAGMSNAEIISSLLDIPLYYFSHQEGHIAAVCGVLPESQRTVSFHMSGGTGEMLETLGCKPFRIVGGTKDISFGQLIDRTGVALGSGFPAGALLDDIACRYIPQNGISVSSRGNSKLENPVTSPVKTDGAYVNLSGIETQIMNSVATEKCRAFTSDESREKLSDESREAPGDGSREKLSDESREASGDGSRENPNDGNRKCSSNESREVLSEYSKKLIFELFCRITDAMAKIIKSALKDADADSIILVGGVSSSRFLRSELPGRLKKDGIKIFFGDSKMSTDNACGIARLGAAAYNSEYESEDK